MTLLFLLPIVVFVSGVWTMSIMSGLHSVTNQKPLNQRCGYDTEAVAQYWGALDSLGHLRAEQRFLELDLVFPALYGTALAVSLLTASAMLRSPVHIAWLLTPVIVTVIADWTENLVLLEQLRNYIEFDEKGLAADWIQLASIATIVKLLCFSISSLAILTLLVVLLLSPKASQ